MVEYCNITTDLQNVCSQIEQFAGYETVENFTAEGDVYFKNDTGTVSNVREDGLNLTLGTSKVLLVGTYYYDATLGRLYVRCTDDEAPSTHEIEINSSTWTEKKTYARKAASGELEGMLGDNFPRPLPVSRLNFDYLGNGYDPDITKAVAYLTCANLIEAEEPDNQLVNIYRNRVWNGIENTGLIYEYIHGQKAFSFEVTKSDYYGVIEPIQEATEGRIKLLGTVRGVDNYIYRVKITTAGAVETAKFDFSDDNGRTWMVQDIITYNQFQYLANGLYIAFEGTFSDGDEWKIKTASSEETNRMSIGSVILERN